MSILKQRYNITPQMKIYDEFTVDFESYTMFFNKKLFNSKIVNTDELGFRYNFFNNKMHSFTSLIEEHNEFSLIVGGSTVFGFGATGDDKTISSLLTKKSENLFLNFGATAFNSKQELILFINNFTKLKKIKKVIIISGVNDLYLNIMNNTENNNFFFKNNYLLANNLYKIRNNISKKILYLIYKFKNDKFINPNELVFKDLFKKKKTKSIPDYLNKNMMVSNYNQVFGVWSSLSQKFEFEVSYFFQPLAGWLNKEFHKSEKDLFNILDNSNDFSHNILKKISLKDNYMALSSLLKTICKNNDIKFYDLNEELSSICNENDHLFVDRVHLTDYGYELISKIILNKFK